MDLIRRIALETAELPPDDALQGLDGIDNDAFVIHVEWMEEAGLVKARTDRYLGGGGTAVVFRLTWDGCEFADAVRSDTLWKKAKDEVLKPASSFTFGVIKEWLKAEIQQGLPTLRGGA